MVSFKVADQTQGGLLDDRNVEIKNIGFVMWDYEGSIANDVPALRVEFQPWTDDWSEEDGDINVQHFSAGDAAKIKPSKDGKTLEPVKKGEEVKVSKSSNFGLFIRSIVEAGYDDNLIEDDITIFDGMKCHVARRAQPKRGSGIKNAKEDAQYLAVVSIKGEDEAPAKGAKGKTAAPAAGKGKAKVDPLHEKADEAILALLEENALIKKTKITTAVFQALKKDPNVKEIVALLDDDFLGREGAPYDYDGTTVSKKD
jgi:hypothetical protein